MGIISRFFRPKPKEEWTVVAYLDGDYTMSYTDGREPRAAETRSVLMVSDHGRRKVKYNFDDILNDTAQRNQAKFWCLKGPMQLKAWETGGPLPDDIVIMKDDTVGNERRPDKVPEALRRPYREK